MYVPKEERKFGHFTLPVLHDNELVGRLDSQVDRKSNVLVVNKLHWEDGQPKAATRRAVDAAIAELAAFVGAGEVKPLELGRFGHPLARVAVAQIGDAGSWRTHPGRASAGCAAKLSTWAIIPP